MEFKKVEGHDTIVKDEKTGLIINRDTTSLRDQYRRAKNQALSNIESRDDIKELQKEVSELSSLKEEIADIKEILMQLVSKQVS